jgi:hypothetical protein
MRVAVWPTQPAGVLAVAAVVAGFGLTGAVAQAARSRARVPLRASDFSMAITSI